MNKTVQRIHLIRHGETNWNKERRAQGQQESELTLAGKAQAEALRDLLAPLNIGEVHCSSSKRTRQTAAIAFADHPGPVNFCERLREIHMGPWEGLLYDDIRRDYPEQYQAFWHSPDAFCVEGAESFAQVQARAVARLEEILTASTACDIAIVSHGLLIKTILSHVEQRPLAQVWEPPLMHNCALSTIEIHNDGSRRISLYANQTYPLVPYHNSMESTHE